MLKAEMENSMYINLDEMKEKYRPEEVDVESYGVYIEMEAFILIRELLNVSRELQLEVYDLREEVNELYPFDDRPYPFPADDIAEFSFFITCMISSLYEKIFDEDIFPDI